MLAVMSVLEAGDEAIVVTPNFMQLPGLAKALGAKVHLVPLQFSGDRWAVASLCERRGIYLHADEIYRGAELAGPETSTLFNATPMAMVTGGTAKAMALAGLRIGWLVAPVDVVARAMERQDYTTIGSNTLGQRIAMLALRPETRAWIVARNRALLASNIDYLSEWLEARGQFFSWTAPQAGAMAFLRYSLPMASAEFCHKLREQQSVFLVAGSWFGMEGHLRIGIGGEAAHFRQALQRLDDFIKDNF
jgi:aspartate/methionine/tyrosine aminotransferase